MIDKVSGKNIARPSLDKVAGTKDRKPSGSSSNTESSLEASVARLIEESESSDQLLETITAKLVEELLGKDAKNTESKKQKIAELAISKIRSNEQLNAKFSGLLRKKTTE